MATSNNQYIDPTGELTEKQLKFGTWYVTYKEQLRQALIVALSIWCTITIGYSLIMWGAYLFVGMSADQNMAIRQIQQFPNYTRAQALYGARDLGISSVEVYPMNEDTYGFVANVQNPNERWIAHVQYHFTFGTKQTQTQTQLVMPQSGHVLASLGFEHGRLPTGASLQIEEVKWEHISAHDVPDIAAYKVVREDIAISNVKFARGSAEDLPTDSLQFTVTNNTAYSFWEYDGYLELLRGNQRLGMMPLTLPQLRTMDERIVDIRLFGNLTGVTNVRMYPLVDIFDQNEFMEPGE